MVVSPGHWLHFPDNPNLSTLSFSLSINLVSRKTFLVSVMPTEPLAGGVLWPENAKHSPGVEGRSAGWLKKRVSGD